MRSLYDDIIATLEGATFSFANVQVRKPFDPAPREYPMLVVHEIVNIPLTYVTVNGEDRTTLSYQIDVLTKDAVDTSNTVVGRYDAGRTLVDEVVTALGAAYSFTRRTVRPNPLSVDVMEFQIRGDCILDRHGYAYRP